MVGDSRSGLFVGVSSLSKETELAMVFCALGSFVVAFGFVAMKFSFVVFQMITYSDSNSISRKRVDVRSGAGNDLMSF